MRLTLALLACTAAAPALAVSAIQAVGRKLDEALMKRLTGGAIIGPFMGILLWANIPGEAAGRGQSPLVPNRPVRLDSRPSV